MDMNDPAYWEIESDYAKSRREMQEWQAAQRTNTCLGLALVAFAFVVGLVGGWIIWG